MTYTNLSTHGIKNVHHIHPKDIVSRDNDKFDFNKDFWMRQKKPLNILWDEIHLTANSRKSMSSINMVFSRFIAMGRRIVGFDKRGYGTLTFIAQAERTIDVNIKELASEIRYHKAYWHVDCNECGSSVIAHSEMEQRETCVLCGSWNIERKGLQIEVKRFKTWNDYINFKCGMRGSFHFQRYMVNDIENYFKYYDTMQIEDIWENYLTISSGK